NAFTIKAWDGLLASASSVQVKVQVNPRNIVNVNSLSDSNLAGKTNLRQAIAQANSFAGDTSIVFDESLFASPQTIILGSVITIGNSLGGIISIEGPSNGNLRISGNNSVGLFMVNSESRFKNLTLSDGVGAGISAWGGAAGGAIFSNARIQLSGCLLEKNTAIRGGGIYVSSSGRLAVYDSTISQNTGSFDGGGVFLHSPSIVADFRNSTIANNNGHGIFSVSGELRINSSTITRNTNKGVTNQAGPSSFNNSIIALNSSADLDLTLNSTYLNNCLYGSTLRSFGGFSNIQSSTPILGSLGNYGGMVPTVPLLLGSPAINAGSSDANTPTNDQRGFARFGQVDIGAFERQEIEVPVLKTPTPMTFADTSSFDSFSATSGNLVATVVDPTTLTYGITGVNAVNGIATKVGTYGTLVVNTSTGAYTFTPNNNAVNAASLNVSEKFSVSVNDGTSTAVKDLEVKVIGVNDRPVVTAGATLAYTENDSPIVIDAGLLVSDVDDSHISGATVTIGQVVPGDFLGFTNQNGITGTYVSQTGTLTLSGAATVAQYQQALRSVTFSSTNEDPTLNNTRVNRTISWVVTDSNSGNASNGVLTSDGGSGVSTTYLAGSTYTLNSNGTNPYVIPMDLGQNWSFEAEYRINSSNGLNTLFSYGNYTDGVLIRTFRSDSLYVKGNDFNQIDVFGTSNTNGSFVPVKITYTTTGTTGTLSIYAAGSLVKSVTSLSPLNPVDKTIRIGSAHHSNGEGLDGAVRNINVTVGIGSGTSSQVNITAVNDAPTLQTPEVIIVRDTAVLDRFGVISSGLVGSDVDANTTLTYGISGGTVQGGIATKVGTYGTLVLTTSTGAYTFTPNNAAINALTSNTTERFTIGISDGIVTTDADLEVRLVAANDTPTLQTPEVITVRDTAALDNFGVISSGLVGSDVDANTTLTYGISGGTVQGGIATKVGTYGTLVL
ncbi:MAG: choice-of-anchor Q domain-containing protein, partial [Gemmataceae bacterium]